SFAVLFINKQTGVRTVLLCATGADCGLRCRNEVRRGTLRDQVLSRRLTLGVVIFDLSTILLSRSPARSICCRIAWRAACSSLAWIAAAIAKCSSSVAAFVRSSWKVCGYHTPTRALDSFRE